MRVRARIPSTRAWLARLERETDIKVNGTSLPRAQLARLRQRQSERERGERAYTHVLHSISLRRLHTSLHVASGFGRELFCNKCPVEEEALSRVECRRCRPDPEGARQLRPRRRCLTQIDKSIIRWRIRLTGCEYCERNKIIVCQKSSIDISLNVHMCAIRVGARLTCTGKGNSAAPALPRSAARDGRRLNACTSCIEFHSCASRFFINKMHVRFRVTLGSDQRRNRSATGKKLAARRAAATPRRVRVSESYRGNSAVLYGSTEGAEPGRGAAAAGGGRGAMTSRTTRATL
ncbi:hypothetical protein EVAR_9725_1 [Eumeta japonica]|uniref:Uncharacterized protein n=1 Tax=Eumeta variegata TaxID=151549 RepID=A0A4C1U5B2_EUMVA|nr:hypothetical protein EVAR_9725_1 [Eumeta japonica]